MARTIEISDETYETIKGQLKAAEQVEIEDLAGFVGRKVFIRTVTYHYTGEIAAVMTGGLLRLKTAAWIAVSGRFWNAIKTGVLSEVEPIGDMYLNSKAIVDIIPWNHDLPTEQK